MVNEIDFFSWTKSYESHSSRFEGENRRALSRGRIEGEDPAEGVLLQCTCG